MKRSHWMSDAGYRSGQAAERADHDPERLQAVKDQEIDNLVVAASISFIGIFAAALLMGLVSGCLGMSSSETCGPGTLNRVVFSLFQGGLAVSFVCVVAVFLVRLWRG